MPSQGPPLLISASPDPRILAFTLGLTFLTGIIFGLLPALRASRPDPWTTLKDTVGSIAGGGGMITLPMLAKILSQRHGFKCTVLFSVDKDGTINPNLHDSLPGAEALDRVHDEEDFLRLQEFLQPFDFLDQRRIDLLAPCCVENLDVAGLLRRPIEARRRRANEEILGAAQTAGCFAGYKAGYKVSPPSTERT